RATGCSPTAGRSRGELMALGRVLAPRFQPCTLSVGWAAPRAARDFFLHNSPAALAAGRATGCSPTAGRSRGELMALGRVLAPRFQPCTLSVGWAAPSAARDFFLHNSPAALAAGRATGCSPTAGRSRGELMGSWTCARYEISAVHFIRWLGGA